MESPQLAWIRTRQKPLTSLHEPVRGFGPDGSYMLRLASPRCGSGWRFVNGEPEIHQVPSCLDDPTIRQLRDDLIRGLNVEGHGLISIVDAALPLYRYAAALVRLSYQSEGATALADEDLTFILSGQKWYEPIIRHALGGNDIVQRLAALVASPPHTTDVVKDPPVAHCRPVTAKAVSARTSPLQRLRRFLIKR